MANCSSQGLHLIKIVAAFSPSSPVPHLQRQHLCNCTRGTNAWARQGLRRVATVFADPMPLSCISLFSLGEHPLNFMALFRVLKIVEKIGREGRRLPGE